MSLMKLHDDEGRDDILVFAHIGDLHLTDAKQRNFLDFMAIVAQIETECADAVDFVFLPGDNADQGRASQYALAATALKMLRTPFHTVPGDHDMEQGNLDAFYAVLKNEPLPKALTVRGVRCLFLDVCGPGGGGPDFRLGRDQLAWTERELGAARQRGEPSIIFMHTYPADLKGEGETQALNRLIAGHDVLLVDMGHTHYNELANDGRTIFAATRSTGQIEEGPAGYALITVDRDVVSWRFKLLDDPFPFVIITAPADRRLLRDADQSAGERRGVRAIVFGHRPIRSVACQVDDGQWIAMTRASGERCWSADVSWPADSLVNLTVQAIDASGRLGQHAIEVPARAYVSPARVRDGSDADSIGAWPQNGIFGTQLGPNRNGKPTS